MLNSLIIPLMRLGGTHTILAVLGFLLVQAYIEARPEDPYLSLLSILMYMLYGLALAIMLARRERLIGQADG